MESKNALSSKTVQGLLVMLITAFCGDLFSESDAAKIAETALLVGSALWALWGRCSASKRLTLGKSASSVTPLLLACVVVMPLYACAAKQALEKHSPHEQARYVAYQLGSLWLDLDTGYRSSFAAATPEQRRWMATNYKPVLESAKPVVEALISAAKAWTIVVESVPAHASNATYDNATMSQALAACEARFAGLYVEAKNIMEQAQLMAATLPQGGTSNDD